MLKTSVTLLYRTEQRVRGGTRYCKDGRCVDSANRTNISIMVVTLLDRAVSWVLRLRGPYTLYCTTVLSVLSSTSLYMNTVQYRTVFRTVFRTVSRNLQH